MQEVALNNFDMGVRMFATKNERLKIIDYTVPIMEIETVILAKGRFQKNIKEVIIITYGSDHFFWQLDQFLSTFGKKCIFPFEKPQTKISTNWSWTCKMSGSSLKMLAICVK